MYYKILKQQRVFQGFFAIDKLDVQYESFNGGMLTPQTREVFERGHAAAVMPYDPVRDEVVWIEQFRVAGVQASRHPWIIETVAGIYEANESPEALVRREAREEAGCEITELELILDYLVSPGGTSETIALYCGRTDTRDAGGVHGLVEEGEDIKVHVLSFEASVAWLEAGRFDSATPLIAMQWLILNRDKIRKKWGA